MSPNSDTNSQIKATPPEWLLRAVITVIVAVLAAVGTLWVVSKLHSLIVWIIVALFLSFALEPLVNTLAKKGWKRGRATIFILLVFIALVMLIIGSMIPLVISQLQQLINNLPSFLQNANRVLHNRFNINLSTQQLNSQLANANLSLGNFSTNLAGNLLGFGSKLLGFIFQSLTIFLFTFYFVVDGPKLRRSICSLLSPKRQHIVLRTWEIAIEKTGGYLYSRLLMGSIAAVGTFVVLMILGVPFALPLALWMGIISQFVPIIGTYIAAGLPLLVAAVNSGVAALIFLVYVIIYQQIENYILAPRITAKKMNLHPAVAFGAAIAGGLLQGAVGAFLALPVAAIVQASVTTYLHRHEVVENINLTMQTPHPLKGARLARVKNLLRKEIGKS